jgi:hypothetical protein
MLTARRKAKHYAEVLPDSQGAVIVVLPMSELGQKLKSST